MVTLLIIISLGKTNQKKTQNIAANHNDKNTVEAEVIKLKMSVWKMNDITGFDRETATETPVSLE